MNEERLRKQQVRIDSSKNRETQPRKRSELDVRQAELSREQQKMKKQLARLESQKLKYNLSSSQISKEETPRDVEKQDKNSQPNTTNTKSRLFEYEKSAPRSRRQLQNADISVTQTSSSQITSRAVDPEKTNYSDIVAAARRGSILAKESGQRRRSLPSDQTFRRVSIQEDRPDVIRDHATMERQRPRRGSVQADMASFRRASLPADHKYSGHNLAASTRRSSTQHSPRHSLVSGPEEDDDTEKLRVLYNKAIETVQQADESLLMEDRQSNRFQHRRLSEPGHRTSRGLDVEALNELQHILNDARLYTARKHSVDDHSRHDISSSNRAQKKRIEHLEEVLKQLNHGQEQENLDPAQVLQCSYLRLSASNVQALEDMMRKSGRDPGIHIHSDVTNYDIWKNMKEERADLREARAVDSSTMTDSQKERHPRSRRNSRC